MSREDFRQNLHIHYHFMDIDLIRTNILVEICAQHYHRNVGCPVFCPGLKKGMVLLEEKVNFCFAKLNFKGTFARGIIF